MNECVELKFQTQKQHLGLGEVRGRTYGRGMLITGRNGSGKTQLLNAIAELVHTEGWARQNPRDRRPSNPENPTGIILGPLPGTCERVGIAGGGSFISEERMQEEHMISAGMMERAGVSTRRTDHGLEERKNLLGTIARQMDTTYEALTEKQANDWLKKRYEGDQRWGASVTGLIAARQREIYSLIQERAIEVAKDNQTMGEDIQELFKEDDYARINEVLKEGGSHHIIRKVTTEDWQEAIRHNFYASKPIKILEIGTEGPVMDMGNLSTGEQKLLWLAGCALKADRWNPEQSSVVLLLDEFDTGLHPALKKQFINMVESLMAKGIWVIMTTHDPITVGLAREEWVHVLESWWERGQRRSELQKTTRKNAIKRMLGTEIIGPPYAIHWRQDEMTEKERVEFDRIAEACSALREAE